MNEFFFVVVPYLCLTTFVVGHLWRYRGPAAPCRRHRLAVASGSAGSFAVDLLPASPVAALGTSLAFIPTQGTAISTSRPEEGGLASGNVNTSYQIGSLGLAHRRKELSSHEHHQHPTVQGTACNGCASNVTGVVNQVAGLTDADIDLTTGP